MTLAGCSLDAAATRERLAYPALVDALAVALVERADGRIRCPERSVVAMTGGAVMLSMPAAADDVAIHKLISVAPRNAATGLPVILGQVTVLDPRTGRVRLSLDGPTVTGRRTAAMSMLAVRTLCRRPLHQALLFGTGVQAGHHVEALAAIFPGTVLHVRGTSTDAVDAFCRRHDGRSVEVRPWCPDGPGVDVVFTCTTSRTPVYREPARVDRLVVAVGAFEPAAAEIAAAVVRASVCYVDDRDGASHEAGDLLQAGVAWSTVRALGDATATAPARDVPLLFKSVGCAAWDLAAARVASDLDR